MRCATQPTTSSVVSPLLSRTDLTQIIPTNRTFGVQAEFSADVSECFTQQFHSIVPESGSIWRRGRRLEDLLARWWHVGSWLPPAFTVKFQVPVAYDEYFSSTCVRCTSNFVIATLRLAMRHAKSTPKPNAGFC